MSLPAHAKGREEQPGERRKQRIKMFNALRYYWIAAKGYRLRPWHSPYIRWRMETFLGPEASPLTAGLFFHLLWRERARLREFMRWTSEYRRLIF